MLYKIFHVTQFRYSGPITESVMELRKQPRNDDAQRLVQFALSLKPSAHVFNYVDYFGNTVHHFDIPEKHQQLEITSKAIVEVLPLKPLPEKLSFEMWKELDEIAKHQDFWEFVLPSHFAKPTEPLLALGHELSIARRDDPLTLLKRINTSLNQAFDYSPDSTSVDSPIDEAITQRRGVCQDFSNIMIALVRQLNVPCRYVSGYLFHRKDDRSHIAQDATHAWVEAYLPTLGWIGFDPTNNLIVGERHTRVAIGRDYADVPPTRGVFKGDVDSELSVGVRVAVMNEEELEPTLREVIRTKNVRVPEPNSNYQEQQQQ